MEPFPATGQRLRRPRERLVPNPKLRFMDQCREVMRFERLALRSEEAYLQWIKRFVVFHRQPGSQPGKWRWRHPRDLGAAAVRAFLTDLAARRKVQRVGEWFQARMADLQQADRQYWRGILRELKAFRATGRLMPEGELVPPAV